MHVFVSMCVCVYICMKCILPVLCAVELVKRLSFGLLIPFYSTGIMFYSNPNPIWGVWRWHEDDVTVRTRRETENQHGESQPSARDRLQLPTRLNDSTESFSAHSRLSLPGGRTQTQKRGENQF